MEKFFSLEEWSTEAYDLDQEITIGRESFLY